MNAVGWELSFRVKYAYGDDSKVLLDGLVDPVQLVKEFYHSFLSYPSLPQFNCDGWEIEYRWERLTRDLKLSRQDLEQKLLTLSRPDLEEALFGRGTTPLVNEFEVPPSSDPTGNFDELVGLEQFRSSPTIPFDYDERSLVFKQTLIAECLNYSDNDCNGSKLLDLRSEIIDNFLSASPKIETYDSELALTGEDEDWPEVL